MVPRPSYWPSWADWSPPVQKALSPAPASTMTPMLVVPGGVLQGVDQLVAGLAAKGVHALGPVDEDPLGGASALDEQVLVVHGDVFQARGRTAVASSSILPGLSSRSDTKIMLIAG